MFRSRILASTALLLLGLAGGCATMENLQNPYDPATKCGGRQVYGGTKRALATSGEALGCIGKPGMEGLLGFYSPLAVADVPLSVAADTLTLPLTVPESMRRTDERPRATARF